MENDNSRLPPIPTGVWCSRVPYLETYPLVTVLGSFSVDLRFGVPVRSSRSLTLIPEFRSERDPIRTFCFPEPGGTPPEPLRLLLYFSTLIS